MDNNFFNKVGTITSFLSPHCNHETSSGILLSIYHMNIFWATAEVGGESQSES